MKKYMTVWLIAFVIVGYEYMFLNFLPQYSLLLRLQTKGLIHESLKISTAPGRTVSLWLGWIGLSAMIVMNLYSMRKRFGFMQNWGKLSDWLNFHIFCGLLGPMLIIFHCDFKVRGLVAISFWSMVVSFTSGIIGRYFYIQIAKTKVALEAEAIKKLGKLDKIFEKFKLEIQPDQKTMYAEKALAFAGVPVDMENTNPLVALASSIVGDLRIAFLKPEIPTEWPTVTRYYLADYASTKRRATTVESFQKMMGHWHTFHFPFAVFMYVVAVIHVATALILGV